MNNTTKNSDLFINAYNQIDAFLRKEGEFDSDASFTYKVKSSKNSAVKKLKDDLIAYGQLRNVIVHSPKLDEREIAIAEPHDVTVSKIVKICQNIVNPRKVLPSFQFNVLGAEKSDYINNILKQMRENSFSQFPIFNIDGSVEEIITTNTISRWLSSNIEPNGTIIIENVKVESMVNEIEYKENFKFISRDASIFDAYDLFLNHINSQGFNLDAIFITHSGKKNEKLLGLITIVDIANEMKNT